MQPCPDLQQAATWPLKREISGCRLNRRVVPGTPKASRGSAGLSLSSSAAQLNHTDGGSPRPSTSSRQQEEEVRLVVDQEEPGTGGSGQQQQRGAFGENPCCICLEDPEAGDEVARLGCGHEMHFHCIEKWIQAKGPTAQCPICKGTIGAPAEPPV